MAANPDEYARLYRDRMRTVFELMRPSFRPAEMDPASSPAPESSRASEYSRLTTASVLYVRAMVAPARRLFAWGVPTAEAIEVIRQVAGVSGVVEIGAGTGYWTHILRLHGVPVTAYDLHPCDGADTNGHHASSAEGTNPPPFASVRTGRGRGGGASLRVAAPVLAPARGCPRRGPRGRIHDGGGSAARVPRRRRVVRRRVTRDDGGAAFVARTRRRHRGAGVPPSASRRLDPSPGGHLASLAGSLRQSDDLAKERALRARGRGRERERDAGGGCARFSGRRRDDARGAARAMREGWEEASVAHVVERARRGGYGAGRGAERRALDAVRRRSGWMRRALLAFL